MPKIHVERHHLIDVSVVMVSTPRAIDGNVKDNHVISLESKERSFYFAASLTFTTNVTIMVDGFESAFEEFVFKEKTKDFL